MSDLKSIAYVSTAIQELSAEQLEALLLEAREQNRDCGITGVLLYDGGNFMQYFEGGTAAVDRTYERILSSRKHKAIIELLNEPVAQRSFAAWLMAFAQPTQSEMLALSTAQWKRQSGRAQAKDSLSAGMGLLLTFWGQRNG